MTEKFKWPKVCANCKRPIRRKSWNNLRLLGEMGPKSGTPEETFELRNCDCGSTLMVPLNRARKTDPPPAA